MTKVTIAIPTYNREDYLRTCLQSILRQTFQDFTIIIFDNHSNYDLENLVNQFHDTRITICASSKNVGQKNNFDRIYNHKFHSPYLIIFHDDDAMHPTLLSKQVALLDDDEGMVFVATGLQTVRDGDLMNNFIKSGDKIITCRDYRDFVRVILRHFDLCFDSVMYRIDRITFADITTYDHKFSKWSDRPYLIDIAKMGKVAVIDERLINYRIHSGQDSRQERPDKFSYLINLYNYYRECLPLPSSGYDKKLFYRWSTNNLILAISWFSSNWREYFKLWRQCLAVDLFRIRYFNIRGLYYAILVIKSFLNKRHENTRRNSY